ncbi:class I SAM-dependent methyltransferase [Spirosoma rhododendri]|uniref:Class I SAM-dependent methyltransferase n=1 Tax=Spirosoma rhododendri TaxID=2728024 RepID=A0A7L5DKC5_9BACT|nr:class I SAM-dependent methyltransferase [Spirosoma rhododendri]QJD77951.1 class I SAM-dependent methyltransferase [Spirosoma rhododendri]
MSSFETVQYCPVCSGTIFSSYVSCKDYLVSNQTFEIQSCDACGFRLTNPRPDAASIGQYYKSEEYISHNDSGGGLIGTVYKGVRSYTLRAKLALINSLVEKKGRLLDVGCGTGSFLETCQKDNWQIAGMEPDADARSVAKSKLNVALASSLAEVPQNQYNVITLWHVLEHIAELEKTVARFHQLLDDSGSLLIAVPNSDSYDAQTFGPYWAAFDVPRHLHHFTPETIKRLFEKHSFKLADKKPMVFDSFYISMLSSRYQTGQTDYLQSIRTGLQSNLRARKTGNWSSLIYIFKKA